MNISLKSIGIVHSPFNNSVGTPIQPGGSSEKGEIEIYNEYREGIEGLEGFSHIILLYHFHKILDEPLRVKPFMDNKTHGVFATRSPARPNRIGFSVLRLKHIRNNRLVVENIDILDGTPVIDVKPYVPQFDSFQSEKIGWLVNHVDRYDRKKDDGRFL